LEPVHRIGALRDATELSSSTIECRLPARIRVQVTGRFQRATGLGTNFAAVTLFMEQSEGMLTLDPKLEQTNTFVAALPRCDVFDYLV
jgi:hypothetical protein